MGGEFSEKCIICKMQTLPCPPALTTNPALQLGGNTSAAQHSSSSPVVAGTMLPSCQILLTWIFSSRSSSRTLQKPSIVILSFVAVSPNLWGLREAQLSGLQPLFHWPPLRHWTAGHQGYPRGQKPDSPRFSTHLQKEVGAAELLRETAAGLSPGKCGALASSRKLQEKNLRSQHN